jgi:hypothetical protein
VDERLFFIEKRINRPYRQPCPHCGQTFEYQIRWIERRKKDRPPAQAATEDIERFRASRSYMLRQDDMLVCQNARCRKRFEIGSQQSVVFI